MILLPEEIFKISIYPMILLYAAATLPPTFAYFSPWYENKNLSTLPLRTQLTSTKTNVFEQSGIKSKLFWVPYSFFNI